jgi:hypothetical protein
MILANPYLRNRRKRSRTGINGHLPGAKRFQPLRSHISIPTEKQGMEAQAKMIDAMGLNGQTFSAQSSSVVINRR